VKKTSQSPTSIQSYIGKKKRNQTIAEDKKFVVVVLVGDIGFFSTLSP